MTEGVIRSCSVKKVFLKILQYSQDKTQMFFCEFCKIYTKRYTSANGCFCNETTKMRNP